MEDRGQAPTPRRVEVGSYLGFGCWAGLRGSVLLCPAPPRPGKDGSDPGEALCPRTEVAAGRVPRAAVAGPRSSSSSQRHNAKILLWSQHLVQDPEPHQPLRHLLQNRFPHTLKKKKVPSLGAEFAQKHPEEIPPRNGARLSSAWAPFALPLKRSEGRPRL